MFFDADRFDFARQLEANWLTVKEELEALRPEEFIEWPERELHERGWWVFGLVAFGQPLPANCARCPKTAALLQAIPGMSMAGFSALAPGAVIRPHTGYTNQVLRCHLGLVSSPLAGLRVGPDTRTWEPGKCLVFDDTVEHEAWNRGPNVRIVLLIDFAKPNVADPYANVVPAQTRAALAALMSQRKGK